MLLNQSMAPAKNSFSYADISFNGKLKKKKKIEVCLCYKKCLSRATGDLKVPKETDEEKQ